MNGAKITPPLI